VKAVDKDLFFDDVLGTAVTDTNGRFEITYDAKDFRELFEKSPDLYVVVRDRTDRRILFSNERNAKWKAGADEYMDIPIPRKVLGDPSANISPYGPDRGKVSVRLALPAGQKPPELLRLYFREHLPQLQKQHAFSRSLGEPLDVELPSGEYSFQAFAPEFETARGLVNVTGRKNVDLDVRLEPRKSKVVTFDELLASYGIDPKQTKLSPLDVEANTVKVLDYRSAERDANALKMLETKSIAQLKAWTGTSDQSFGHDRPVFGRLPNPKILTALSTPDRDLKQLSPEEREAAEALAQEYIHGNSQSIAKYEKVLNSLVAANKLEATIRIPSYFYTVVTVGAGATLQIGNGSTVFACSKLRVHRTGKVRAVGSVTVKVGTYEEFS